MKTYQQDVQPRRQGVSTRYEPCPFVDGGAFTGARWMFFDLADFGIEHLPDGETEPDEWDAYCGHPRTDRFDELSREGRRCVTMIHNARVPGLCFDYDASRALGYALSGWLSDSAGHDELHAYVGRHHVLVVQRTWTP